MNKLKHAFIAPINYMHLIPSYGEDVHLLLAHLLENKNYCEYYKKRQKELGDFIIIDNGAFEFKRPLEAHELYKLINNSGIEPNIVVAPDYPFEDWTKTVKSTLNFSQEYHNYFGENAKLMAVPQSKEGDYEGWINAYKIMCQIPEVEFIGMSILGIPNAFCSLTKTKDITFNRVFATDFLKSNNIICNKVKHHYLGCSDPRELLMMRVQGVAYSNDSSTAFWHAINGIEFDDTASGLMNGKIKKEVDFFIDFDKKNEDLIKRNIRWIENLLSNNSPTF